MDAIRHPPSVGIGRQAGTLPSVPSFPGKLFARDESAGVRGPSESDLTKLLTGADWHARGWQRPWSFANADQITVTVIDQSLPEAIGEYSNVEN